MRRIFKILTFVFLLAGFIFARGYNSGSEKSAISLKINQYYFEIGEFDNDALEKKRSHKRRKIKRKPRRGRDNR